MCSDCLIGEPETNLDRARISVCRDAQDPRLALAILPDATLFAYGFVDPFAYDGYTDQPARRPFSNASFGFSGSSVSGCASSPTVGPNSSASGFSAARSKP